MARNVSALAARWRARIRKAVVCQQSVQASPLQLLLTSRRCRFRSSKPLSLAHRGNFALLMLPISFSPLSKYIGRSPHPSAAQFKRLYRKLPPTESAGSIQPRLRGSPDRDLTYTDTYRAAGFPSPGNIGGKATDELRGRMREPASSIPRGPQQHPAWRAERFYHVPVKAFIRPSRR